MAWQCMRMRDLRQRGERGRSVRRRHNPDLCRRLALTASLRAPSAPKRHCPGSAAAELARRPYSMMSL